MSDALGVEEIWEALTEDPHYLKVDGKESTRGILKGADLTRKSFVGQHCAWQWAKHSGRGYNDFKNLDFTGSDFSRTDMSDGYTDIQYIEFTGSTLDSTDFSGHYNQKEEGDNASGLSHLKFIDCSVDHIRFIGSIINDSTFTGCTLTNSDFSSSSWISVTFKNNNAANSNFEDANITARVAYYEDGEIKIQNNLDKRHMVDLDGNNFTGSNFNSTTLFGVLFQNSNLTNTSFKDSTMKEVCFHNVDLTGVDFGDSLNDTVTFDNATMDQVTYGKINNKLNEPQKSGIHGVRPWFKLHSVPLKDNLNEEQNSGIKGVSTIKQFDLVELINEHMQESATLEAGKQMLVISIKDGSAIVDPGEINRFIRYKVPITKLKIAKGGLSAKYAWLDDLEQRCRDTYGKIYEKGADLVFTTNERPPNTTANNNLLYRWVSEKYKEKNKVQLPAQEPTRPNTAIRLVSAGKVKTHGGEDGVHTYDSIGYVQTKIPGTVYNTYFALIPPESLKLYSEVIEECIRPCTVADELSKKAKSIVKMISHISNDLSYASGPVRGSLRLVYERVLKKKAELEAANFTIEDLTNKIKDFHRDHPSAGGAPGAAAAAGAGAAAADMFMWAGVSGLPSDKQKMCRDSLVALGGAEASVRDSKSSLDSYIKKIATYEIQLSKLITDEPVPPAVEPDEQVSTTQEDTPTALLSGPPGTVEGAVSPPKEPKQTKEDRRRLLMQGSKSDEKPIFVKRGGATRLTRRKKNKKKTHKRKMKKTHKRNIKKVHKRSIKLTKKGKTQRKRLKF